MHALQRRTLLMSASRQTDHATDDSNHWLTIAAVIALVYALSVIGVGLIGTALNAGHSLAHWVGRTGSLAVILGVLLHHQAASPAATDESRASRPNWRIHLAPFAIAAGLVAIVTGFALGVLGY
jgi:hypothetical protein